MERLLAWWLTKTGGRTSRPSPPTTSATTHTSATTAFSNFLACFPSDVLTSVLAPFLTTRELLAACSTCRAGRRLLSPELWRQRVFKRFRVRGLDTSSSAGASTLPFWFDTMQQVRTGGFPYSFMPDDWPLFLSSLPLFPQLRSVHAEREVFTSHKQRQAEPCPRFTSLISMRQLTRLTLSMGGVLQLRDLQLLATLPALASLALERMHFEAGDEATLSQWQALSAQPHSSAASADGKREAEAEADEQQQPLNEDAHDPALPLQHSPLLIFLHHLAVKPSLVLLRLQGCGLSPFVMDRMPVWPHLLCLSVEGNHQLESYTFAMAAATFPSLTSLTSPSCSDEAVAQLARLPRVEELRFPQYSPDGDSLPCLDALREAMSLRSLFLSRAVDVYECHHGRFATLTAGLHVDCLVRLAVPTSWMNDDDAQPYLPLLSSHRFTHLRCLELVTHHTHSLHRYKHMDATLLPLIKPADCIDPGRRERQSARAAKRWQEGKETEWRNDAADCHVIPYDGTANFPALECVALWFPDRYHGVWPRLMSAWTQAELRRSYEYERASEWEAEQVTLGQAELLKTMR